MLNGDSIGPRSLKCCARMIRMLGDRSHVNTAELSEALAKRPGAKGVRTRLIETSGMSRELRPGVRVWWMTVVLLAGGNLPVFYCRSGRKHSRISTLGMCSCQDFLTSRQHVGALTRMNEGWDGGHARCVPTESAGGLPGLARRSTAAGREDLPSRVQKPRAQPHCRDHNLGGRWHSLAQVSALVRWCQQAKAAGGAQRFGCLPAACPTAFPTGSTTPICLHLLPAEQQAPSAARGLRS